VLTTTTGLAQLKPHVTFANRELFDVLLNATSAAEANLALEILHDTVPEKSLVMACNLREVIRSFPASPFAMHVDEQTLTQTAGLEKDIAVLRKFLPDGIELAVTTAGNLVLDIILKVNGEKYFWSPVPVTDEFVNPTTIDLILESDYLLDEIIELVKCMGLVFNPKFYLSIEDFHLEYAAEAFCDLAVLF
jgi:hypothetical protein